MLLRLRSLLQRRRVERELAEELRYHLERQTEEFIEQGITPTAARQAAERAMGSLTRRKEECRDAWHVNALDHTVQDVRYGWRVLVKSPAFTAVAVLTLAMAIGANAVVFGVLDALVIRPLNVPDAENLYATVYGDGSGWQNYPGYVDLRERNRSFTDLAAFKFSFVSFDTGQNPASAAGFAASGNYFDVLRIQPHLGRFFHASDERGPNSAPYVVLSHAYWRGRFAEDRGVIGRTVLLNRHPFTIIGVTPPDFRGTLLFVSPDFFVPIVNQERFDGKPELEDRASQSGVFEILGRLKPGVTPAQASADVNAVGAALQRMYPKEAAYRKTTLARPGLTAFSGPVKAFVAALAALAGLILLAACANLGGLFAARAADRSREVALRLALGSSRSRILRQLLTEALLIALAGGAAGLFGSLALLRALTTWQPFPAAPVHLPVTPDAKIYAVALALAVVCGLLAGILPARQVLRADPYQIVKAGAGGLGRRLSVRDVLLAAQIAICAVLVTSSLVAVRGLVRSLGTDLGVEPRNTIVAGVNLAMAGYQPSVVLAAEKRMVDALAAIPGVTAVGLVNRYPPLAYGAGDRTGIFADTAADLNPSKAALRPYKYEVSPGYFSAAGTRLLAGRDFTWHDDEHAPRVAVVNREFAERLFGSVAAASGRFYKLPDATRIQVVGVVENGKYFSLTEDQQAAAFLSYAQWPSSAVHFVTRSAGDPQQMAHAVRTTLRQLDSGLLVDTQTWTSLLAVALFPARTATLALGVLGAMAALLAVTGIFGMAAYSVSRRLKELGIRMAIGARRTQVLRAALGRSAKLLAFGSAAGLVLGLLGSRVLASIVYQATPKDPLVLGGVVFAMALVGLVATWIPAQRALRLDPVTLLREE